MRKIGKIQQEFMNLKFAAKIFQYLAARPSEFPEVNYFAKTRDELRQPPKRGRGNPNAGKNFEKFNLRSL
jgi:hypothetical protein